MSKRRELKKQKRKEVCHSFYNVVMDRYYQIMSGGVPYIFSNGYYTQASNREQCNDILTPSVPIYGEQLLFGRYPRAYYDKENTMTAEMMCYTLNINYRYIDGWRVRYAFENDEIFITLEYASDYRVEFDEGNTFRLINCHDGSLIMYNKPLWELESVVQSFTTGEESPRFDIVGARMCYMCVTSAGVAVPRNRENIAKYKNIYLAQASLIDGHIIVKHTPIFLLDMKTGRVWRDASYLPDNELRYILNILKGGQSNGTGAKTSAVQHTGGKVLNNRGFTFNKQEQGATQVLRGGVPGRH